MSRTWLGMPGKIIVPLLITLGVMALLLLLGRTTVYSLTAVITTDKAAAGNAAEYALGEAVVLPITVSFSENEQVPEEATIQVLGNIVGFNPVTVPLTEGSHTLTSSLPSGYFLPANTFNAGSGNVKLIAEVAYTNILNVSGYGYGYGYMGGTGGGDVVITVKYYPPVMLYPQPAAAAGPLTNPTVKFSTSSSTPGTPGTPGDPNAIPDLPEMKFKNNIPPIPGSMPSADKLGFDVDGDSGNMAILVDGFTGQADSIGFFSTGNFMQFKGNVQPGQDLQTAGGEAGELQGVVITKTSSGEVSEVGVVGGGGGATPPFFALINKNSGSLGNFDNSTPGFKDLTNEMTDNCSGGGALQVMGVAYASNTNKAYAVGLQQNDMSCPSKLVEIDLADGSANGMDLDIGAIGLPCCYGMTYLEDTQVLLGVAKDYPEANAMNVFYKFGTGGSFEGIEYPYHPGQGGTQDLNHVQAVGFDNDGDAAGTDNYIYGIKEMGEIFYGVAGAAVTISYGALSDQPIAISIDPTANVAYVVFDGNPQDGMKVLDLSAADPMDSPVLEFNFDSEFVESAVFIPASIGGTDYIWDVDSGNCGDQKLEKRSTTDGALVSSYSLPGYVSCDIGGMDVDDESGNILIIEKYNDKIHSFDITTGNAVSTLSMWDNDPNDPFWMPGGGESLAVETIEGNKRVLIGKQNKLFEVDIDTGGMMKGYNTPLMDVTGMGGGTTGALWLADKNQQKIYQASLPGAEEAETTTVGSYTAKVDITPTPTNASTNWTTSFDIKKISSVTLAITSPEDGGGVASTALDSDGKINISGTIDDFTIKTVSFGATLGVTTLVGAPPSDPEAAFNLETSAETSAVSSSATSATTDWEISGLWNVVTATTAPGGNKYQGGAGMYYGQVSNWNYETGAQTAGNFDSPTFTVGAGSKLTFNTYYDTEPSFDWDQKTVQFCTNANSCNTLLQLVDMPPPPQPPFFQMPNPGFIFNPMQVGANWGEFADGRKFAFVPMTQSTNIEMPLSKTLGTGFLRFRFDSKDPFMNQLEGWYVDNIQVTGAGGAAGVGFAVSDGAWSGKFKPSEGENKITVTASHTAYDTSLNGTGISTAISVFLDTVSPIVAFDDVTLPTKTLEGTEVYVTGDSFLSGVIKGTFTELVPDTLEVFTLSNTSLTTLKTKDVFTDSSAKNVLSKKTFDKTTLAEAADAEANQIEVESATGLAVGSQITIGTTDEKETVTISAINGEDIDFYPELENDHDSDETVQEVTWSKDLNLGTTDTFITVGLKLSDKGGLTDTETLVLSLDTTGPALTVNQVVYPIGATSARAEDELIFDVSAVDALSGVDNVLFVEPSGPRLNAASSINDTTVTTDYNPYSVGRIVVLDTGSNAEARTITAVSQSQSTGMYTLTLDKKLKKIHVEGTMIAAGQELLDTSNIPDVVVGKFGILGTHIAFATVPTGTPAGQFSIQIAVSDTGGNTTVGNATGTITASLQAENFYVLPGGNLLGMNLQPTYPNWSDILAQEVASSKLDSTFVSGLTLASTTTSAIAASGATTVVVTSVDNLAVNDGIKIGTGTAAQSRRIASINTSTKTLTLNTALTASAGSGATVAEFITLADLTKSVFYFTGGTATTGSWQSYSPSVAADTLSTAEQGKAYWLFLKDDAFKTSTPLPGFTTGTSIPLPVVVAGVLFDASAEPPSLPTTVPVVAGWNLISLVAEKDRTVEQGARGLMFPTQTFTSLAEYQKFVDFDSSEEEVTVVEGVFNPLFTGTGAEDMKVGRGFYVFMSEADTHTP